MLMFEGAINADKTGNLWMKIDEQGYRYIRGNRSPPCIGGANSQVQRQWKIGHIPISMLDEMILEYKI